MKEQIIKTSTNKNFRQHRIEVLGDQPWNNVVKMALSQKDASILSTPQSVYAKSCLPVRLKELEMCYEQCNHDLFRVL
jgi:hypothetical protein